MSAILPARPKMFRPRVRAARLPDRSTSLSIAGILAVFCALWFFGTTPNQNGENLRLLSTSLNGAPEINATSLQAIRRFEYVTVVGELRNLTAVPLTNVEAVVEVYDSNGTLSGVESALLGVRQFAPVDTTPFTVVLRESGK